MKPENTEILKDVKFQAMMRRKGRISGVLTLLIMLAYFGFIALLAFKPNILAVRVSSGVNLGIPFGIGVILWACILTGLYVRWANSSYDDSVEQLKAKLLVLGDRE